MVSDSTLALKTCSRADCQRSFASEAALWRQVRQTVFGLAMADFKRS